jgi:hypothetical protein
MLPATSRSRELNVAARVARVLDRNKTFCASADGRAHHGRCVQRSVHAPPTGERCHCSASESFPCHQRATPHQSFFVATHLECSSTRAAHDPAAQLIVLLQTLVPLLRRCQGRVRAMNTPVIQLSIAFLRTFEISSADGRNTRRMNVASQSHIANTHQRRRNTFP